MRRAAIAERNASIAIPGERVIVAGGTQGIGRSIACRFAQAGAEVWIIGRNETKANATLERLKEISQEKKIEPLPEHQFIKADLSLVSEIMRTAQHLRTRAGTRGIDYLVMTQGGPPNGLFVLTSEGLEQHYTVQVLSRLVLTYKLAVESDPVIKKGVASIMSPAHKRSGIDYDDLDLRKANDNGTYWFHGCAMRDSVVIDVITEEFARRVPDIAITHLFPGFVKTDFPNNVALPWFARGLVSLFLAVAGDTPTSYAEVPFYLLAHPEGRAATSRALFWDQNAEVVTVNPTPKDESIRTKIWDHVMEVIKTHSSR